MLEGCPLNLPKFEKIVNIFKFLSKSAFNTSQSTINTVKNLAFQHKKLNFKALFVTFIHFEDHLK